MDRQPGIPKSNPATKIYTITFLNFSCSYIAFTPFIINEMTVTSKGAKRYFRKYVVKTSIVALFIYN